MRYTSYKSISLTKELRLKILLWAQQFETVAWYDSNHHKDEWSEYDALLAVEAEEMVACSTSNALEVLTSFRKTRDWAFGFLSYDVKNEIEPLSSQNHDALDFPKLSFFRPKRLLLFKGDMVEFQYLEGTDEWVSNDWNAILATTIPKDFQHPENTNPVSLKLRTSKEAYFEKFELLKARIQRGDLYEVNFCQEFYSEETPIDPLKTYWHLNELSKPPFACFVKMQGKYILSASPERFLKKKSDRLWSQPIKGTASRSTDTAEDQKLKKQLQSDPKERSENIMIVDLVRNDLARIATRDSVQVTHLCDIKSYAQVHQMVSTIQCSLRPGIEIGDVLRATFPMGSMTGAPKISAMQHIETVEDAKRGVYSGAIGYITPNDDFDFNVVIRTILYDEASSYVSFSVGGALTIEAKAENEYLECLLKAKAMRQVLEV
ncbi:anthranilate synthase component I family protein [Altibacter sp. HG106]|uniref:anthranilate synthase component I family protein n=1 Tax=Altibacter sp. HG106 TaxID=3023937 RepID=UPI0023503A6F|nr:anthranilate synthase component I family protein [Altibacter sp. HG106]MDC7995453.1 anthranilate synthase component I family protein [Altibacter sp. HG106]